MGTLCSDRLALQYVASARWPTDPNGANGFGSRRSQGRTQDFLKEGIRFLVKAKFEEIFCWNGRKILFGFFCDSNWFSSESLYLEACYFKVRNQEALCLWRVSKNCSSRLLQCSHQDTMSKKTRDPQNSWNGREDSRNMFIQVNCSNETLLYVRKWKELFSQTKYRCIRSEWTTLMCFETNIMIAAWSLHCKCTTCNWETKFWRDFRRL